MRYAIISNKPWNAQLAARLGPNFVHMTELSLKRLDDLKPRYVFFPHWSERIGPEVYENYECVIFHMTELPYGRGGSPLQNLIQQGFEHTMVTAIRCVGEMDAGPVYWKQSLSLGGTAEEIYTRADRAIERMIGAMVRIEPTPVPQAGEPTYFRRRTPEDSNLKGRKALTKIYDQIRMVDAHGYPHAFLELDGLRLEFTRASLKANGIIADVLITETPPEDPTEYNG